jgi:hypothetical protein
MDNLELLQADLKHHIEFVKFIEGKCLAFLAAATALAAVSLGALANPEYSSFRLPILNVAFFALLAVVFLACAVLPIEVRPKRIGDQVVGERNIFFFADTSRMSPSDIVILLPTSNNETEKVKALALMLSEQVIVNGRICLHKINFLRAASFCLVASVASPFVAGAVAFVMWLARARFRDTAEA